MIHHVSVPRKAASREQRLQWLDSQLRARRHPNAQILQETFGISKSTAFSDVRHLRDELGAVIEHSAENGGWYYIEPPKFVPLPAVNATEASALRRALLVAREYLGDSECVALQRISDHVGSHVPAAKPIGAETARGASHLLHSTPPALLLDIGDAITNRQKLQFRYKSPRREDATNRVIHPLHLDNVQGEWYLIAHCELRGGVRTFHLSRIQNFRLLPKEFAFERPEDFDARTELERALLLESGGVTEWVVVDFDAYQAGFIRERIIHPSEEREELPDGGLRVRLQITVGDEVKRWLLGYGRHVTVREPNTLRREMADEIAALQKMYE